jgi:hypothetical protein
VPETWLLPNNDICICLLGMRHSWIKNAFWFVNNKKWRIWCKFDFPFLINNTYGLIVLTKDNKFSNQFFCVWLVDLQTICVKNGWKHDSFQIMILVHVCSTCSVFELKMRFETWKARNVTNNVSLFHLSYLMTHMAYVCSLWTPNVQINYFRLECSIYVLLVLNRDVTPSKYWYSYMFARHEA